jgi:hypothetical protein
VSYKGHSRAALVTLLQHKHAQVRRMRQQLWKRSQGRSFDAAVEHAVARRAAKQAASIVARAGKAWAAEKDRAIAEATAGAIAEAKASCKSEYDELLLQRDSEYDELVAKHKQCCMELSLTDEALFHCRLDLERTEGQLQDKDVRLRCTQTRLENAKNERDGARAKLARKDWKLQCIMQERDDALWALRSMRRVRQQQSRCEAHSRCEAQNAAQDDEAQDEAQNAAQDDEAQNVAQNVAQDEGQARFEEQEEQKEQDNLGQGEKAKCEEQDDVKQSGPDFGPEFDTHPDPNDEEGEHADILSQGIANQEIAKLQAEHDAKIRVYNDMIEERDALINEYFGVMTEQQTTMQSQEAQIQSQQAAMQSQHAALQSHETQIQSQQAAMESQQTQNQSQQTTIVSQHSTIVSQQATMVSQRASIQTLETKVSTLENEVSRQDRAIEEADVMLDAQSETLATQSATIQAQSQSLDAHGDTIAALRIRIETHERTLVAFQHKAELHDVTAAAYKSQALSIQLLAQLADQAFKAGREDAEARARLQRLLDETRTGWQNAQATADAKDAELNTLKSRLLDILAS